jgi:pimeloyl-ACP methyl ester carboxylesterase
MFEDTAGRDGGIIRRMHPREETISVGGVDVHVWIGGHGDPLLVLHGAGGNRGFTRWMRQVAEHFTVWAPTHPGFGRSGDAEWMDGIDDLARFHLWLIDAAGLGRPHVLGHSIGGWTAAEMAAMSPGAIDRLVLVAPAGLKPDTGEILDVFYHSPLQLRDLTVHDPGTVPEWDELFGAAPTPAEMDLLERNREMTARLTWKPYMHSPTLSRFLPRVTNPTLVVWGREDRIIPVACGEQYRRLLPRAQLRVLDGCGHLPPVEQPERFARLVIDFLSGGAPA